MGARTRGFLLFSFAFSSVLSSPDLGNATGVDSANNNTNTNVAINRDCIRDGNCSRDHFNVEKREISYSPSDKLRESSKEVEAYAADGGLPAKNAVEKRARVGFTGMRGKKEGYSDGLRERDLTGFFDLLEKRARYGFEGMRGKKDDDWLEKRAPMGFQGMRGKKDDYESYEDDADEYGAAEDGDGVWDKRTMAFHGMRGRRTEEEPVLVKRVPLRFDDGYNLKRALGFLGMRGKKTPETWSWYDYGKRGVQSRFYGMKGKKAQSGFFGMRGKKSSPDLLGIPVDGESLDNEVNKISTIDQPVSSERVRRGTSWLRNSKKAKNAFFAVRGKKSSEMDDGSELSLISSSE
ncbi:UNVERIFIED_CONTAM: hypothetical protein PYX00_007380 [Menopon gallinae]|uniref:Uncharacterized protein n=1 Tax=Menopon gallinae TaxID=328185 RepID=A0AAW2HIY1_9NEOP